MNPYLSDPNQSYQNTKMPINQLDQYSSNPNKLKNKQSSKHIQAFIANIILLAGVTTTLVLNFATSVQMSVGLMAGILGGSYGLYVIIGCCCNIEPGVRFQSYYDQVRAMIGRFFFTAVCYHYQIRHHRRTRKDSNGHKHTQHYTTNQKVITHSATQYLTPIQTRDQSGQVDRIRANTNIVFIHFDVKYRFIDQQSNFKFQGIYANFKQRHTRDSHQDFGFGYQIPGLVERKAFYAGWLVVATVLGMLWPYSIWVERRVTRFSVQCMKVLTI